MAANISEFSHKNFIDYYWCYSRSEFNGRSHHVLHKLSYFPCLCRIPFCSYMLSMVFFVGWDLRPRYVPSLGPLGSGSLGLFVSSSLGPYKSQHCSHIGLLCIPRMIHEGDCGVIGGTNDDCRGNRRTWRKPAPAPLCPTTNPT
jgi:hypothetical protein